MMLEDEKNAFMKWLIEQKRLYEGNLIEDDTLTGAEKSAAIDAVSSFIVTLDQTLKQMSLYAVYCDEDYDGAVYAVPEADDLKGKVWEQEDPAFQLTKVYNEPILTFGSILSQRRYEKEVTDGLESD